MADSAIEQADIIGDWAWDASTGRVRVHGLVASVFNVNPDEADAGVASEAYVAAIHPDDRDRVHALARRSASEGIPYLVEYRVISADGRTRWVLARGQFSGDHADRLVSGSGILIDIDDLRRNEGVLAGSVAEVEGAPLDRAAEHAIAAQQAIVELQDEKLKVIADALLMALGRKLAQQEVQDRRRRMN